MRIERELNHFLIVRGRRRESYFCFFVDSDSACWTVKSPWQAQKYVTEEAAEQGIKELKMRARSRKVPHSGKGG